MMKHSFVFRILAVFLLVCAGMQIHAETLAQKDAEKLLALADKNTSFAGTDFAGDYIIVKEEVDGAKSVQTARMYRRDSNSAYTILLTSPDDRGKGYVQYDNTIWFYDPHDKQFVLTSAKDKFENSNANTGDFTPQHYSRDYAIVSAQTVKLGTLSCVVFDLKAKIKDVSYPKIKVWVTADDGLIRKKEDYSLSGQLLRTTAIPSYQKFGKNSVPDKMLIVDNLRKMEINGKMQYEKTQVTITNVSFAKQSSTIYTKKYIEMMSE